MRIRWLITVGGTVEGRVDGVKPGDEMDLPEFNGKRYIAAGYAVEVKGKSASKVEYATVPDESEKAVVGDGEDTGGEAESEPKPVRKKAPVKRTPRTPRRK